FGKLHDYARQIGADYVASGHYARVDHGTPGGPRLRRGLDTAKDQSYVLFGVRRDQLPGMLLPIGSMHKARVREVARELGLPVFDKPDSQEICFVPDNDYAALVESRRPDTAREGPIVDTAGKVVGTHPGQHRFTIGQRRGLSLSLGSPVYVVARDAATNTVVVGPREQLLAESCIAAEANFLVEEPPRALRVPVLAKYRYNSPPVHAVMVNLGTDPSPNPSGRSGSFRVTFDQPQAAVAAGQAVVLYDAREPDRVVGGGWIRSVDPLPAPRA
ncbi:MAG: tRNA 2-thiouridine(34) synthase MnmA, partial [Phycisphaerae bacterium]|nr:tRNA 2-thiouridine(34) synthase MnmA [Phycisphaerae bacterium]